MTRAVATALLSLALIGAPGAPLLAQRRVTLEVAPPAAMAGTPTVTTTNLFGDPDMRDLVRSGFPASLRFRLELWRVGGLFNDLEGQRDWELIVQYDPSAQRYRVVQRQGGRLDDLGSFATLSTAQAVLERPTRILLAPEREGSRYYYNLTLTLEALSVSDMDQLERWLRGVRGGTAASALGSGMRTLMLRMLGGEKRVFDKRSATFTAER
ncbi:MAG TPA: DUF4390 domain-containing protein [Gemmatimonadaceae bacterium]|nr:DUF4390 domain-containing protein [Gemmatimonadaceae bacterium]